MNTAAELSKLDAFCLILLPELAGLSLKSRHNRIATLELLSTYPLLNPHLDSCSTAITLSEAKA
jgi:hypothetical protein